MIRRLTNRNVGQVADLDVAHGKPEFAPPTLFTKD